MFEPEPRPVPIQRPYCQHALSLKEAKPERYTPRCPKCQKKFQHTAPEDPSGTPAIAAIRPE